MWGTGALHSQQHPSCQMLSRPFLPATAHPLPRWRQPIQGYFWCQRRGCGRSLPRHPCALWLPPEQSQGGARKDPPVLGTTRAGLATLVPRPRLWGPRTGGRQWRHPRSQRHTQATRGLPHLLHSHDTRPSPWMTWRQDATTGLPSNRAGLTQQHMLFVWPWWRPVRLLTDWQQRGSCRPNRHGSDRPPLLTSCYPPQPCARYVSWQQNVQQSAETGGSCASTHWAMLRAAWHGLSGPHGNW